MSPEVRARQGFERFEAGSDVELPLLVERGVAEAAIELDVEEREAESMPQEEAGSALVAPGATYLVTGGAGFIGSTIVRTLLEATPPPRVRVLDNFSSGHRSNLAALEGQIEVIEGDLRDRDAIAAAVQGADYLIHQAALVSVPRSVDFPEETDAVNAHATVQLLRAAQQAGVRRAVIASSAAVYGDNPALPLEEHAETRPLSPYAASKLATEGYASVFSHTYGLPTIALRYFNVYGPRQDPASQYAAAIPIFISRLLAGRAPTVFGDGSQTRDFVFVEDVVRANLQALTPDAPPGEVFNIAGGSQISLLDLLETLNRILGSGIEPEFASPRAGDIVHSGASIRRAVERLGWWPEVTLEDGLRQTVAWFSQHG